jgi:hypothetical protein
MANSALRRDGLAKMQQYENSLGLTGLHQMGDLDGYLSIVEDGDPTLRLWYGHYAVRGKPMLDERDIDRTFMAGRQVYPGP